MLLGLPLAAYAGHAYVSNEDGRTVSVIDTDTAQVVDTIEVGKRPRGIKISPDGRRLYVAVSGLPKCPPSMPDAQCAHMKRDLTADGIAVVDLQAHKVVQVLPAGSDPEQFDIDRSGRRLYVANEDSGTLSVVDIARGEVLTRIAVGREPEGVRISPDGERVGVTSETDSTITFVSTHLLEAKSKLSVGHRPRDLVYSRDGRIAYAPGEVDSSVYRLHVPDGPVEQIVQLRPQDRPMGVLLDASRARLYVSTGRGGSIAVIALEPRPHQQAEVEVGARPWGMALTPNSLFLYTANGSSNDVSVVNAVTLKVVRKIPVGRSPWGVVIGP